MEVSIDRLNSQRGLLSLSVKQDPDFLSGVKANQIGYYLDKENIPYSIVKTVFGESLVISTDDLETAKNQFEPLGWDCNYAPFYKEEIIQHQVKKEELQDPVSILLSKICPMSGEDGTEFQFALINQLEHGNFSYAVPEEPANYVHINQSDLDNFTNYVIESSEETRTVEVYIPEKD